MTGATTASKQSIYICRYGLTKHPLVEGKGPYDSELDPTEGMEHAKAIATRIAREENPPKLVYCSPFVRTTHTAQLIALELRCSVNVEEGLTEWQIPSLLVDGRSGVRTYPKSVEELAAVYGTINLDGYQSLNPYVPDDCAEVPKGAPHFEESETALLQRCATTTKRILDHAKGRSLVLVSHAPCDQAVALFLEGEVSVRNSKLGPWPLGGITKFSRTVEGDSYGEWTMDMYGNCDHMPGKWKTGLKEWSLPILSNGRAVEKHASFEGLW